MRLKKEWLNIFILFILVLSLILPLSLFKFRFTGNVILGNQEIEIFENGIFKNLTYYNSSIFLTGNNSTGQFISKIFSTANIAKWNNISWKSNKIGELHSNFIGNSSRNLVNMTGIILLLNFNKINNNSTSGEILDFSKNNNNFHKFGNINSNAGKLNNSITFDGVSDYISRDYNFGLDFGPKSFTISGWFKTGGSSIINKDHYFISKDIDDAEERISNGNIKLSSAGLDLVKEGNKNQTIGLRFQNINLPKDAKITNAYLQFTAHKSKSESTNLSIYGENIDDSPPFINVANNIIIRNKTNSSVNWVNIAAWTKNHRNLDQRSPDLSNIMQEIIDREGWSTKNSITLIINGTGKRIAKAYSTNSSNSPTLIINYSTSFDKLNSNFSTFFIGSDKLSNKDYFNGSIDELAIWNRSLSSNEILDLYKMGSLNLNLKVRSCNDSLCQGEDFIDIVDNSPQILNLTENKYFQYMFNFESDNNYTPELFDVSVDYSLNSEFSNLIMNPNPNEGGSAGGKRSASKNIGLINKDITNIKSNLTESNKKIDLNIIQFKNKDNNIKINYSLEESLGINQTIELKFLIINSKNETVYNNSEYKFLPMNSKKIFESSIHFNNSLKEKFTLLITTNSQNYIISIQEKINKNSPITSFAIFKNMNKNSNSLFFIFLFFILFLITYLIIHKKALKNKLH